MHRQFERAVRRSPWEAAIGLLVLLQGGCHLTEFRETYYVGVVDENRTGAQFYRFDVRGTSGWTRTKYASGWFSADAIEKLVGDGMGDVLTDVQGGECASESVRYFVTGPEGRMRCLEDKRLAIIMSSDPEPITQAIQAFATSDAVQGAIADLAERRRQREERATEGRDLLDRLCNIADTLPDGTHKQEILNLCGLMSTLLGGGTP